MSVHLKYDLYRSAHIVQLLKQASTHTSTQHLISTHLYTPILMRWNKLSNMPPIKGKLVAMSRDSNRTVCHHCLCSSRSELGHKQCQIYNSRILDHFQAYIGRNTDHSLRITPQYLVQFIQLNPIPRGL